MIEGSLNDEKKQLVARPYRNLSSSEDWVYDEDGWGSFDPNGNVEKGYRVTRRPNDTPSIVEPDLRPAKLNPELIQQLMNPDDSPIEVFIAVRNFPDWDIPIAPRSGFVSVSDFQRLSTARDVKISSRKALLTQKSQNINSYITQNNGQVLREAWKVGYILAELPKRYVRGLLNLASVLRVEPNNLPNGEPLTPRIYLGTQGAAKWTGTNQFFYEGYEGGQPNVSRHGYYDMLAATIAYGYFEDEACAFQESSGQCGNHSTDRIKGRWDCAGSYCTPVNDFDDYDEEDGYPACIPNCAGSSTYAACVENCGASHATKTMSIITGDYTQGQAIGWDMGDVDFNYTTGTHSFFWKRTTSGIATEAYMLMLGGGGKNNASLTSAFGVVAAKRADSVNASWDGPGFAGCDISSQLGFENAMENAYDDGVFVTASAGNSAQSFPGCQIASPADGPKAFAVNALSACTDDDYNLCTTSLGAYARGGGNLEVDGSIYYGAMSFIDLTAPSRLFRTTEWDPNDPFGVISYTYSAGTSISAPVVNGAAIVLKDFMLSEGHTFMNSPGRLQAMMLGMGDSWHDNTNSRASYGMDNISGAGRLKMRLFDSEASFSNRVAQPFRWRMRTYTFTSTGSTSFFVGPMAVGTDFAKCVLWEGEDMSGKDDVSDIWLSARVTTTNFGSCSTYTTTAYKQDASFDLRHMVHFDSETNLDGKCLYVTLHRAHVTNQGTTVNAFCYSAGESDNEN